MRLKSHFHEVTLSSGITIRLADWFNVITHVRVPWNGEATSVRGMLRESEALITSFLVLPDDDRAGQIDFRYNAHARFSAPVRALMDRYHGLTMLDGVQSRLRLLGMPTGDWINDLGFDSGLQEPIHMRENLPFALKHTPPPDASLGIRNEVFTVEIQALVKKPYDFSQYLPGLFRWDVTP